MPTWEYLCAACDLKFIRRVMIATRDAVMCPMCQVLASRQVATPRVLNASYHEGKQRPGWEDLKKISKLRLQNLDETDPEIKKQIQDEIEARRRTMKAEDIPLGMTAPKPAAPLGTGGDASLWNPTLQTAAPTEEK